MMRSAAIAACASVYFSAEYAAAGNDRGYQSTAEMAKVAELLKYATIVVSSLPLSIMYPFFQKYFDQGIMVGSVKG